MSAEALGHRRRARLTRTAVALSLAVAAAVPVALLGTATAQRAGRGGVFRGYRLRVAAVLRDYGMHERAEAPQPPPENGR